MKEQNKELVTINDLKICDNCGNVFTRNLGNKEINRCPACNVWKKENGE